jgi:transposase-like protein
MKKQRRTFSDEFKLQIVGRLQNGETMQAVCTDHQLSTSVVRRWQIEHRAGNLASTSTDEPLKRTGNVYQSYTPEFKQRVLAEWNAGATRKQLQEKYKVPASMLSAWKHKAKKNGHAALPVARVNGNGKAHATLEPINAHHSRDAIVFLNQAKRQLLSGIRSGDIRDFDNVHLMSMLALNSLTGGTK